jgi:hypothetical protein
MRFIADQLLFKDLTYRQPSDSVDIRKPKYRRRGIWRLRVEQSNHIPQEPLGHTIGLVKQLFGFVRQQFDERDARIM